MSDGEKWVRSITEAWVKNYELPEGTERERWFDEATTGFGVVVGKRSKTFIVRHRVNGKREDVTIGQWGKLGAGDDGSQVWTEARARKEAKIKLGEGAKGITAPTKIGETLNDAFDAHAESLTKKIKGGKRSPATLVAFEKSRTKIQQVWPELLEFPVVDLTGEMLSQLTDKVKASSKARANAVNEQGAPLAVRVIRNVSAAWSTLNKRKDGKLGNWNPAKSVEKDAIAPKRVVLTNLPEWFTNIQQMRNPIQRDGLLVALYTGLRHEDVTTIHRDYVDLDARTVKLPDPKGGSPREFTIPICETVAAIIERRMEENAARLAKANANYKGDDGGWIFPTVVDGKPCPITDLREQRYNDDGGKYRFPSEDVHTLRRTFLSVAQEVGISELDQHVLSNHAFGSHNVNATYIAQHIDHLAACADKIEAGIKARLNPKPVTPKKNKRTLKMKLVG